MIALLIAFSSGYRLLSVLFLSVDQKAALSATFGYYPDGDSDEYDPVEEAIKFYSLFLDIVQENGI